MKIAMMTNNYKPFIAGVPVSIERLSDSLKRAGHEVVVFAPSYESGVEEKNVVRYRALFPGVWGGAVVPDSFDAKIEEEFARGNFDLIHVHHPMLIGPAAQRLSAKYDVPLVFTWHTRYEQYLHYVGLSGMKRLIPAWMRRFTGRCDAVIAPTPGMKSYMEKIGVRTPVTVVPTGLSEESFQPQEDIAAQIRKELLGGRKHLFCTVSRLAKEKNIGFLLDSLAVKKARTGGDFVLAVIGEGPEKEWLTVKAEELGLKDEIVFVGKRPNPEIRNYCRAADIFLFASTTETQGIVHLEAMAAGTPVLAVRATGTQDIVSDGVNGYMTGEDAGMFAQKLEEMLLSGELERLREGAHRTALGYREEEIARRASACYIDASARRRERRPVERKRFYPVWPV